MGSQGHRSPVHHRQEGLKISLPALKVLQLTIDMAAQDPLRFPPFKGTTLRGAFGTAFRKAVCVTRKKACSDCLLYETCVYAYVFETPTWNQEGLLQKTPFAPHPFVLVPPMDGKSEYEPGDILSFQLTLFGRATELVPYFLLTMEVMGQQGLGRGRGKAHLLSARQGDQIVYAGGKFLKKPMPWNLSTLNHSGSDQEIHGVHISFLTPVRLIAGRQRVQSPEFPLMVQALIRRIQWLSRLHGTSLEKEEFRLPGLESWMSTIRKTADHTRPIVVGRFSRRQNRRLQFRGFIGEVVFEGPLGPFLPLLKAGEVVHLGKATSFGFGKYQLKEVVYG